MHELSIAMSIADLALAEARQAKALSVKELDVEIGEWAGVDCDALMFSLDAVIKSDKILQNSKVNLKRVKANMHCDACNADFKPRTPFTRSCEKCGSTKVELTTGRELSLKSLTIDD